MLRLACILFLVSSVAPPAAAQETAIATPPQGSSWFAVAVESAFFRDPLLKAEAIRVELVDGRIRLRGTVTDESVRDHAVLVARRTAGLPVVDALALAGAVSLQGGGGSTGSPRPTASTGDTAERGAAVDRDAKPTSIAEDAALTSALRTRLDGLRAFASVSIDARHGVLALTAPGLSDRDRERLLAEARTVPGARGVVIRFLPR